MPPTSPPLPVVPGTPADLLFGLSLKRKALFYRELATLVEAGLPIVKAVRLAAQHAAPRIAEPLARVLDEGHLLSSALARYPYYFGEFERALVVAGESGGSLDLRLKDLAQTLEAQYDMLQKVLSKLWYPLVVMHVAVFVPTVPLLVLKGPAAYLTATLGTLIPLYLLAFAAFAAYRLGSQSGTLRLFLDQGLSMVPFLGRTLRLLAAARFLDCLGQLYHAGMPVSRCVSLAARSSGNSIVRARLEPAASKVDQGATLSRALGETGVLPTMALQMLETGEEAGRLPDLLARTAGFLHQEVEHTSQQVMTLLPVVLMLVVGALVGFLVVHFYAGQMQAVFRL